MKPAYYNEFDKQAAAWLRELIKRGLIADGDVDDRSILDVSPSDLRAYGQCHFFAGIGVWSYALRLAGVPDDRPVWTGSCPCQPFSAAGAGLGFADERHLWPAWYHLISERRPAVVFGEQVASRDADPWLDLVSADMEGLGSAFGAVAFPSAAWGSRPSGATARVRQCNQCRSGAGLHRKRADVSDFRTAMQASGLIPEDVVADGRWRRCKTTDHPKKANGAYLLSIDGRRGWWKNYATELTFNGWADDGRRIEVDPAQAAREQARIEKMIAAKRSQETLKHLRAAERAQRLITAAKVGPSGYLHRKGFPKASGLVLDDGTLLVPMRDWATNVLCGVQAIRWNAETREWEKKFSKGMRSKGAVFRLGRATAAETWVAEGLATGMSVEAALRHGHMDASVLVTFSASNTVHVVKAMRARDPRARIFGFADNDIPAPPHNPGHHGELACQAAGIRYAMSPTPGEDANDLHMRSGLLPLVRLMMDARRGP